MFKVSKDSLQGSLIFKKFLRFLINSIIGQFLTPNKIIFN